MASGSSARANSSSKGFDFGTDDILCSYDDYGNQETSNSGLADARVGADSSKDFNKSRVTRSAVFPTAVYNLPEETSNQDLLSSIDRGMKKHSDNIMRILEGISSRLSQLELYCYNLDKSIGEMRSDLDRDHAEAESKLKSLDKHVQEVHRSVQILRDKQELAETQKDLAKLQLVQKESTSSCHSQSTDERASDPKKTNISPEATNLALSLPQQVTPQQSLPSMPAPAQNTTQQQTYYVPSNQLSNLPAPSPVPAPVPAPAQLPQSYLPSNPQYQAPQLQEVAPVAQQLTYSQPQVTQTSQFQQPFTQYQQQWPQQLPPQVQPPQQTQIRPQPPQPVYPSYPSQQSNPSIPENQPSNMTMQVQFSSTPQPGSSRVDSTPYGYAGSSRPVLQQPQQQPPPQQMKGTYGAQVGNGYGNSYLVYDNNEGGRTHNPPQQPQYNPGGYPPTSVPLQNAQPAPVPHLMSRNPSHSQFVRNHPHSDLIEKLGNMGFRSDHVAGVIQRLEESGQPVDFNSVLDRLSGNPSAVPQRGWGR